MRLFIEKNFKFKGGNDLVVKQERYLVIPPLDFAYFIFSIAHRMLDNLHRIINEVFNDLLVI